MDFERAAPADLAVLRAAFGAAAGDGDDAGVGVGAGSGAGSAAEAEVEGGLGWEAVHAFEAAHGIVLPEPYRTCVAEISDGCAFGPPDHGLLGLAEMPEDWGDGRGERDLAKPFAEEFGPTNARSGFAEWVEQWGAVVGERTGDDGLAAAVPGVRVVVKDGPPGTPERITRLTTREALASLIADLSSVGVVSVERLEDPSAFAMASLLRDGRFQVWYEADRGYSGADTIRGNSADAAKALHDWAIGADRWEYGFHQAHKMPVPDRIPIAHEPGYRTDLIGAWDDGLFFAGYCGKTYLHLFDHDGNHVGSDIGVAEAALGSTDVRACMARLREIVDALPGYRFGDIAVRLFCVEHEGRKWGLFDLTAGHVYPHVEMEPDMLGFKPPWNGLYDT